MPYIGRAPTSTATKIEDADQDTKIQVEESSDEDTIRFDIAGAEVATLTNSSLVLKGTTPTLTIGDAGAEDAKIVFDGNAQDFHIGLDDTADDLVMGKGSALGTTTALSIDEDLLVTTHGGITMAGATPTLTIGDSGAEDAKIVFDGNAQDFHIGLDDTADDLVIGKGSALGTTTHMSFDENGVILKPLQPSFLAQPSGAQGNFAVGSIVAVVFGTERIDAGSNFASNTFTAPVTGKYCFTASLYLTSFAAASAYYQIYLRTSNRDYVNIFNSAGFDGDGYQSMDISALVDMDAADTCSISVLQEAGDAQTDIGTTSWFSGWLAS